MASGIIIHVEVGKEKRTELFSDERIRIGSSKTSDLQIRTDKINVDGIWLELKNEDEIYRIARFNENLQFLINGEPIQRFQSVEDGDVISLAETDIVFSFFALTSKSSLITTNREPPHIAQFIEEAALGSTVSPRSDEAKAFLREFVRELSREISLTTKLIALAIVFGAITGIFYSGYSFYHDFVLTPDCPTLQEFVKIWLCN